MVFCEGKEITLLDRISTPKTRDEYDSLRDGLSMLSESELVLIDMRYFQGRTQSEVARSMGTNQAKVSRSEKKILRKLKNSLDMAA